MKKSFLFIMILISFFNNTKAQTENVITSIIDTNLSWEAIDSYVPRLYSGRPLPGEQSKIKVVANIEIKDTLSDLNESGLFYDWYINSVNIKNSSGIGKNILKFDLDQLENKNSIRLKIYKDAEMNLQLSDNTLDISPYRSLPIIYLENKNPLIMYSNAINKKFEPYTLVKGGEILLRAEPFYFSVSYTNLNKLNLSWSGTGLKGEQISKYLYKLIPPEYQYGDLKLDLKISNSDKFLQSGNTVLNLKLTE